MRNFVSQQNAAARFQVTDRTIRNWITRGLITGYRLPGSRAIRVDVDEIERMIRAIPATAPVRPGFKPKGRPAYGPKARIVNVVPAIQPEAAGGAEE